MYFYVTIAVFTKRFRDSHFVKSMGVLVYLLVFNFFFLPFFLPFLGFNMKSRFMNNGFLSDQAHAMDFDPTEPGRSSLDRVRPGFPSDISGVWGGISPLNDSDLSSFESNEGGGLEVGPSKSRCKKAALPSSSYLQSSCYKPKTLERPSFKLKLLPLPNKDYYKPKPMVLPSRSDEPILQLETTGNLTSTWEERFKARNAEKYRQSEIYTVIKPILGSELSKTHMSNTRPPVRILRLYTLPIRVSNIRWEEAAEALLGKENESIWKEKIKELRQQRKKSAFYKSAAEWLIQKKMDRGGFL